MRPTRASLSQARSLRPVRSLRPFGSPQKQPQGHAVAEAASEPFQWIGVGQTVRKFDPEETGLRAAVWRLVGPSEFVSLPPSDLKYHCYILGRTGSGKTATQVTLLGQDIRRRHSLVVLDMRGTQASAALELAAGRVHPDKVAIFNLRDEHPSVGFDPLRGAGPVFARALAFVEAVQSEFDRLGPQLLETLRNAALLLAECGEPITGLEPLLYDEPYRQDLIDRSANQTVRDFWSRYSEMSPEKQALLAMPVMNKCSALLCTPSLRALLGHANPLDLGKHLDTPGSITVISLAVDHLSGAARSLGNLMLSSICREIFARVDVEEHRRNPVRLYVDEFENFNSDSFASILAEGRAYKLTLVLAHQVLAQLSPELRSLVLNGVGTKLIFSTGREDGAILSRDLTGDPKALDLTSLPVGEAYFWRRSQDLVRVQTNAPILTPSGKLSPAAEAFVQQVRAYCESQPPIREPSPGAAKTGVKAEKSRKAPAPHLENWL